MLLCFKLPQFNWRASNNIIISVLTSYKHIVGVLTDDIWILQIFCIGCFVYFSLCWNDYDLKGALNLIHRGWGGQHICSGLGGSQIFPVLCSNIS